MACLGCKKSISNLYPPQIVAFDNELYVYSPLQQWLSVHSSTSLKDVIQIETVPQPLYMNFIDQQIVFQSQQDVWLRRIQDQFCCSFQKKYSSDHEIVSTTAKIEGNYINLASNGLINIWNSSKDNKKYDSFEVRNPQSLREIRSKQSLQIEDEQQERVQTSIDVETLVKQYKNGYSFSRIHTQDNSIFTLHMRKDDNEQTCVKIGESNLTGSECCTSYYRCYLDQKISDFMVYNNSILAYGGENLLMVDRRSEQVVSKLNDLPDSSINYVRRHPLKDNLLYVCRNGCILLQDLRKSSEIIKMVLNVGQQIESFEELTEDGSTYFCVVFKSQGKINFYEMSQ